MSERQQGRIQPVNERKLTPMEATQILRDRFNSREWWFFLPMGLEGAKALNKIERQFYWGEIAGPDFEIVTLMPLLLVVAMGKKSRMTPKQLTRVLRKTRAGSTIIITGDTDVVILIPAGMELAGALQVQKLQFMMTAYYPDMN